MSGVTGASFRSNVGSPACTATVSDCSIGSAYLKAFEAAELLYIAESFEAGEAGVHLIMIAGEQRPFAADSRGVWQSPSPLEQVERPTEPANIAMPLADYPLRLCLQNWKLAGLKTQNAFRQIDRRHAIMIQETAEAALEDIELHALVHWITAYG